MVGLLAKLMDWCAIQATSRRVPENDNRNLRLDEAVEFLKGPDFIPQEIKPAQLKFDNSLHFRFPTPRPTELFENNTVYGRFYRSADHWQERPAIVLLHGWNSVLS